MHSSPRYGFVVALFFFIIMVSQKYISMGIDSAAVYTLMSLLITGTNFDKFEIITLRCTLKKQTINE